MRVEVHVDRLVVDATDGDARALAGSGEQAFRAALTAELAGLLGPSAGLSSYERARAAVTLAPREASSGADSYGRAVARSLHAALVDGRQRTGGGHG
ncbi:hypothetical protein [Streptomyces sp. R44]|uniref:Uncharacterized protein n=1 Tax=Streptomyces sp. R44 TaxID=3238633 RepID=A0AB39T7E7_9ACTN